LRQDPRAACPIHPLVVSSRRFSAITTRPAVKKLILLSVIIASVVIPARAARAKNGREGLKKTIIQVAIFEAIYVVLVTQVWFRMS
jgi:hypothetical protein